MIYASDAPAYIAYDSAVDMIKRQISTKTAPLKREIEALNWTEAGAPLRAMALADKPRPANTTVFLRGNPATRGPEVPRQLLEILSGEKRVPFANGSGRLDLAQEIASPKNPLTARVFVNRVWGWHFGQALVRTPSDFGVRTAEPPHRELLDWLAASFVEHGWSVKQLHRWIVLSSTYRQSSDEHPKAAAVDPDNHLVHRFTRHRLEFEALRDTLLAVAGTLDPKAGGLPDDLHDLFQTPYDDDGARVHTNSWGSTLGDGRYNANSLEVDEFVWEHRDCVICFSAGNEGADLNTNGVIDPRSITPPGTAKNCLTIGATENNV